MSTTSNDGRCYRHRKDLVNNRAEVLFELSLDKVSTVDRAAITHIWSLFSSAPKKQRDLILKGILSVCCMPQLSFIYETLQPLLRIDFVAILPRHVNFQIFSYLDATSLCYAAQVSHSWKSIADDERLWFMMCDQHTGKKCAKCGWGLSNKLQTALSSSLNKGITLQQQQQQQESILSAMTTLRSTTMTSVKKPYTPISSSRKRKLSLVFSPSFISLFPKKKILSSSSTTSFTESLNTDIDPLLNQRHDNFNIWKSIYRERMLVEQNWRQNRFIQRELCGPKNGVICIQVCDDLQVIMIGYDDKTIHVYDTTQQQQQQHNIPTTIMKMESMIHCFQFDEAKLIVGELDHSISIWDWRQGIRIRRLQGHTDAIVTLHFNSRNILATGSLDHTIRIWDFQQSQSYVLLGHDTAIRSLVLLQHQSQQLLASAGDDASIRIWDLTTQQCIRCLTGHHGGVRKIVPVPSSSQLLKNNSHPLILSCSTDNTIRLWDIITGQCLRTMFGHMDHVTSLACDPFRIVTGSKDKSLRIWSLDTGELQHVFHSQSPVNAVALSSSGILSAFGGSGCIWDYSTTINSR
ncbi:WD40-repeat-containing domain protein [Halteromyces radiatus]|uniref:WD40-repeat-containing domain protein n=1 Tax=Halteromyces radiatus TaxID=101107 RepID=UPI00221ED8AE|nr:WD40-repeat-containing domain protein [Halteromyces radiatus]KAI8086556.1 WD40-repeat-containing domain protein [Halteromyces radiatus]